MPTPEEYKALLKGAEGEIVSLKEMSEALSAENEALKAEIDGLFEAQKFEAEQMVQLTEQVWKLEEALEEAAKEREEILMLVGNLRTGMERIRDVAQDTLANAKDKKASRLQMAVQVYDIKSIADGIG